MQLQRNNLNYSIKCTNYSTSLFFIVLEMFMYSNDVACVRAGIGFASLLALQQRNNECLCVTTITVTHDLSHVRGQNGDAAATKPALALHYY